MQFLAGSKGWGTSARSVRVTLKGSIYLLRDDGHYGLSLTLIRAKGKRGGLKQSLTRYLKGV